MRQNIQRKGLKAKYGLKLKARRCSRAGVCCWLYCIEGVKEFRWKREWGLAQDDVV
jgi:hypothetical protein